MSEDGRKQQAKLKELAHIAEKLGCTLPQLAIGEEQQVENREKNLSESKIQILLYELLNI